MTQVHGDSARLLGARAGSGRPARCWGGRRPGGEGLGTRSYFRPGKGTGELRKYKQGVNERKHSPQGAWG